MRISAPVRALILSSCLVGFFASGASSRVLEVDIEKRAPIQSGRLFDDARNRSQGIAYELIEGRVHFSFDPENRANARVTDIELAPSSGSGSVRASAEFVVLQPIDPARRRGTALIDVPNRGRRLALASFNRVRKAFTDPATLDPDEPLDWGDGFLMSQGLSVMWVGWQADAPGFPGTMRLEVPRAVERDGRPVRGLARSDWVIDEPTETLALAALGHAAHPAVEGEDPDEDVPQLTRRSGREAERQVVDRARWRWAPDRESIQAVGPPFEAGFIYELVYESEAPPLVGLGFAAFRDFASYVENDPNCAFPAKRTIAHGLSQSGRFLRDFLYEGFNRDEAGRKVFDGVMIQIAGSGRGGFNHRFSHPGRVGNPYENFFYPGDEFPFTSRVSRTGDARDGLFEATRRNGSLPKVFQINTGYEYWGRAASLVHMTPDGAKDIRPHPSERLYHLASAPHYPGPFPPDPRSEIAPGLFLPSAVDTSGLTRALLTRMLAWVERGATPPASKIPSIAAGTLVAHDQLRYPISNLRPPRSPQVAYHLDFGPRRRRGILDFQPPQVGETFAIRVPSIDPLGNEASGIRPLEVAVPIGTYTPWALRHGKPGGADEMTGYIGSFLPLASKTDERAAGDSRPALDILYPTREVYVSKVIEAIDALAAQGFLLPRDRPVAYQAAIERWQWSQTRAAN